MSDIQVVRTWTELLAMGEPVVSFRHLVWFGRDGFEIVSDSILRFRDRAEVTNDLSDAGFDVVEVRNAPDRPGLEHVCIARLRQPTRCGRRSRVSPRQPRRAGTGQRPRPGMVRGRDGVPNLAAGCTERRFGGVFRALTLILPLGFAAALSPMMLTEQTVLLAGADGRRAAARFALGTAVVTVVYLGALVAFGHAISLPKRPTLSATMDLVAGALLLAIAVVIQHRPAAAPEERQVRTGMGATAAFGFGVFSMATNFTSLAILLPAAKDIATDVSDLAGRIALVAVLVALATMPAWIPIATTRVAPGPAQRGLGWLSDLISRNGRTIVVILIAALGAVLIARGGWHILT